MEIKKSIEELVEETFEEFYDTVDRYGRGLRIISDTNTTGRYIYQTLLDKVIRSGSISFEFSKYLTEKYKVDFSKDNTNDIYYRAFKRLMSDKTYNEIIIGFLIDKELSEFLPEYLNKNPHYINNYLLQVRDLCREYR